MEKLKTNTLLKVYFLLLMMISVTIANAQTDYATNNNYTGDWTNNASWNGGTALGTTLGETKAVNITINGEITVSSLTISSNYAVNLDVIDTLIITGNLTVNGDFDLDVGSLGYFILRGNFIINSGAEVDFNIVHDQSSGDQGFFGVKRDFIQDANVTPTGGLNGRQYVLGNKTDTYLSGASNLSDLVANETASTRKLLLGDVEIGAIITPVSPTCNGEKNGSITVEGTGGVENYSYRIHNNDFSYDVGGTGGAFMPGSYTTEDTLSPGTYTVYVEDDYGDSYDEDVTISEKAELTFEFSSGASYFCNAGSGQFTVDVSGGNPPYTVSVNGPSSYSSTEVGNETDTQFTFSNLSGGEYTINVADAPPGCPQPTAQTFDVDIDNAAPTVDVFPDDVFISYATFRSESTLNTDQVMDGPFSSTINTDDVIDSNPLDLSNYENGRYSFTVAQAPASGANVSDIIEVQKSTDGGSNFTTIATYTGEQNGLLTESIDLSDDPADNTDIVIRLEVTIATSGLEYEITNFQIIADERINSETYDSGDATYTDNGLSGVATVESNDVVDWYCTATDNEELTVTRNWNATDNCGNQSTSQPQVIHVGTAPTITAAADMIIDFCNNENIQVPVPTYNDDCGVASISWEVTGNASGASPSSGVPGGSDINLTLAHPSAGESDLAYTITWTVTDDVGFTATDVQVITVKPEINIEIDYPDYDFCSGEEVTFNVTITGGTGEYNVDDSSFGVDGSWAPGNNQNSSGTFTTSALGFESGLSTSFTVNVTDVTTTSPAITGGCPSGTYTFTDGNGDFDIHENISTNELERP